MNRPKAINMTEGPLFAKILSFVLPTMFTNLLQVFYNAADMIVVNLSGEADAVGAIGCSAPFVTLFVNIFIGFAVGANVVAANYIGAENHSEVSKTVHTAILISVIFGTAFGAIGIAGCRPALAAMGNSGKLLDLSVTYVTVYFIGAPFISLTNYIVAILRAKGDTVTPFFVMSGSGLLNVLLNLLFVLAFGMSVDGVALATSVSNAVSAAVLLAHLSRLNDDCRFSLKNLRIDGSAFAKIIHIGFPAAVQGALFSLSNIIIQSSIIKVNNIVTPAGIDYQPVVKGNAATSNLEGFVYTSTNSVYQASVAFTGQNVGAEKYNRIAPVMRDCYFLTFLIAEIVTVTIILLRTPLLSLYGIAPGAAGSGEAIAFETAVTRMNYMLIPYSLLAFMEVGSGVLRGLGKSVTSTVVSLIGSCVLRIVWIYTVFAANPTLESIYISYPISWGITAIIHFVCCTAVRTRMIKFSAFKGKNSKPAHTVVLGS